MATVTVWIPGLLRDFTNGEIEFAVSANTVGGALEAAIARHPLLRSHLADEHGHPRRHVNVFHNQDMVRDEAELDGAVADGDRITILQSVSGGF
jgi:molybdopterin converting factor small subunit